MVSAPRVTRQITKEACADGMVFTYTIHPSEDVWSSTWLFDLFNLLLRQLWSYISACFHNPLALQRLVSAFGSSRSRTWGSGRLGAGSIRTQQQAAPPRTGER